MGGPPQMQFRPQQAMKGQFTPVSGPSQPQQPKSGHVYIVRAPAAPMPGMPQFRTQNFGPRVREKKIIQIKDPNSNKDVTQEILNRPTAGTLTGSTSGTPNNSSPDILAQSGGSNTPLTSQEQGEAIVRVPFAAHAAATLANDNDEKPRKTIEYIQNVPVKNKPSVVDSVKVKGKDRYSNKLAKETEIISTINAATETQLAEEPVEKVVNGTQPNEEVGKTEPKEAVQGSKLNEDVSAESLLGSNSLVSSVDVITSTKEIIPNVRVETFTADEVHNKDVHQSRVVATTSVEPPKETADQDSTDVEPAGQAKMLSAPVALSGEEEVEETEGAGIVFKIVSWASSVHVRGQVYF